MAKNIGVVQYSGSLGNTVGATKSAGQKANTIRIKPNSVKNPKTLAQANQRMQLRAASNLYTALGEILDHSYQNIEYGAPSHNYFMKLATTKALQIGGYRPTVRKGSNQPLPFKVAIAEGTAPVLTFSINEETNKAVINSGQNVTAETSLLVALQMSNSEIHEGDQITFVACVAPDLATGGYEDMRDARLVYHVDRCVLRDGALPSDYDTLQGKLTFSVANSNLNVAYNGLICAFAIIVSRPVADQSGTIVKWERSNTVLDVATTIYNSVYGDDGIIKECLNTYRGIVNSDISNPWYLNQGTIEEDA